MAFEKFLRTLLYLTLGLLWMGILFLDHTITPLPQKILIPPFPEEKEPKPEKKGLGKPEKNQKIWPPSVLRMADKSYSTFSELARELYSTSQDQRAFEKFNEEIFSPSSPVREGEVYLYLKNE